MNLHTLPESTQRKQKRLGLGHGSGRGKTSGRGTKGQKARTDIPLRFEGGALPLIKRLPFHRGKDKNHPRAVKPVTLDVSKLSVFEKGTEITIDRLLKEQLVAGEAKVRGVKILGAGELSVPLTVLLPVSKEAKATIEKAGGKTEALA